MNRLAGLLEVLLGCAQSRFRSVAARSHRDNIALVVQGDTEQGTVSCFYLPSLLPCSLGLIAQEEQDS